MDDNTPNLVTLERHLDYSEALVAWSFLAAHGFVVLLPDKHYLAIHWLRLFALGGVRIQVPKSMAEEACVLLRHVRSEWTPPQGRKRRYVKRTLALLLFGGAG